MDPLASPDAALLATLGAGGASGSAGPNISGVRSEADAAAAAHEFEAFFISQMLSSMFSGVKTPAPFGGGSGEEAFKGMLMDEYGKLLSRTGGIGLAAPLQAEIMRLQGLS